MKHKRIFLFLASALLLCGCGKADEPENPYRLKTTIHETLGTDETSPWRFEYSYNTNGWVAEIREYENDIPDVKTVYEHDAYGNIIRTTSIHPDGTQNVGEDKLTLDDQHRVIYIESTWNGEPMATSEYGYNKDGLEIKLYINRIGALNGEDLKSYVDSTYNRKGNLIRQDIRWEPSENESSHTLYHYAKDRLLRTETYNGETLDYYTDYTYDETGLIQTAIAYKADGTLQSKHVTTFDEYGNQLEVVAYTYASELMRFGASDEEPDKRTTYVYELKEEN